MRHVGLFTLMIGVVAITAPAYAQLSPGGPSGDFRVNDRSGTAPTAGPQGGPSLPPNPMMFLDTLGGKSPDATLKSIDKDLGRSTLERSDTDSRHTFESDKDTRFYSDKLK